MKRSSPRAGLRALVCALASFSCHASGDEILVEPGDTLWSLARRHGVPLKDLMETNQKQSSVIRVGERLRLPAAPSPRPLQEPTVPSVVPFDSVVQEGQLNRPAVAATQPADRNQTLPHPVPREQKKTFEASPPASCKPSAASRPEPAAQPDPAPDRGPEKQLGRRIQEETERIARKGIRYRGLWRPPGERERWMMDCSNTTRWLYARVAGCELPRVASSQYWELERAGRAWKAPHTASGAIDVRRLKSQLRPGDLLFWEHTYKPVRQPPVTHVMVYLGEDEEGRMIMAGSQRSGGRFGGGGPDIYEFDPNAMSGGYRRWWGLQRVRGRFAGYGRPLAQG